MRTILLALVCSTFCCFAQFSPFNPLAQLLGPAVGGGGGFEYPATTGAAYYWVYTNLADGAVTTWTDVISAKDATQSTANQKPTKGASGVYFDSAVAEKDNLVVASLTLAAPFSLFANCQRDSGVSFEGIIGDDDSNPIVYINAGTLDLFTTGSHNIWAGIGATEAFTFALSVDVSGNVASYTNGVAGPTFGTLITSFPVNRIGADGFGFHFKGYIKQIFISTNINLNAATNALLHTNRL